MPEPRKGFRPNKKCNSHKGIDAVKLTARNIIDIHIHTEVKRKAKTWEPTADRNCLRLSNDLLADIESCEDLITDGPTNTFEEMHRMAQEEGPLHFNIEDRRFYYTCRV